MIIIGPFIVIVNNHYGTTQEESPPEPEPPLEPEPRPAMEQRPRMPREPGMTYITCDRCEWEGGYDDPSGAKRGLAAHIIHCKKGRGRKRHLFG